MNVEHGTISWKSAKFEFAACCESGIVRKSNEDTYLILEKEALFCVADGAGGHSNGAMASKTTVDIVKSFVSKKSLTKDDTTLPIEYNDYDSQYEVDNVVSNAAQVANKVLFGDDGKNNMASTLVCCHFQHSSAHITHIGDSRCYLYRDRVLSLLTEDHSLVWQLFREGKISENELKTHPRRNVITRAIGVESKIFTDYVKTTFLKGDLFVLCSDGLSSMISDFEIQEIIEDCSLPLKEIVVSLVDRTNFAGGKDNITIVLIRVV